eukprot:TRINITY_DN14262_c0_g1_i1.p1 TRINITY_DN14262_c0_g1~~TRINITY_DN14262_c0_g1_i1.p1  ORF type:complete len:692 (-),score=238.55 TRINITY_DN14262_c0_g1_i1:205-2280(-)
MPQLNAPLSLNIAANQVDGAVKEGFLFKRGGGKKSKAWKKRYFVLVDQNLLYFKSDKEKKAQGVIFPLRKYVVECDDAADAVSDASESQQFFFRLNPRGGDPAERTYHFYSENGAERADWVDLLEAASAGVRQDRESAAIERKLRQLCIAASELDWAADPNDALIGKGASGWVRRGWWLKTTEVAVKGLNNLPEFIEPDEKAGFYREIEMLSQLRHSNVVSMFGYCKKDGFICLVTEFVKGGNLGENIHDPQKKLDFPLKLELCISTARGMVFLHAKQVIHRDLKPGNILVEHWDDAKVKVCDFGLSAVAKAGHSAHVGESIHGSPAYAAPELPTPTHTAKVDVFSFGVIMWEICTRATAWAHLTHASQIADEVAKGVRLPLPPNNPLNGLIALCWDGDPDARPTFAEIYEELTKIKSSLGIGQAAPSQPAAGSLSAGALARMAASAAPTSDAKAQSWADVRRSSEYSPEAFVLMAFDGQRTVRWMVLEEVLCSLLGASADTVAQLRHSLGAASTDVVDVETWKTFVKWFSPLAYSWDKLADSVAGSSTGRRPFSDGLRIEDIADIVGPSWFHGFLSAPDAKELLLAQPVGSFLFRFSSQPGLYALSVHYGPREGADFPSKVGHWRITTEAGRGSYPVFLIDGRAYESLHHIVQTHAAGGEALEVKNQDGYDCCYLALPTSRNTERRRSFH